MRQNADQILAAAVALVDGMLAGTLSDAHVDGVRCPILAKALHLVGCLAANPRHSRIALVTLLRSQIAWIQGPTDTGLPLLVRQGAEVWTLLLATWTQRLSVATILQGRGWTTLIPVDTNPAPMVLDEDPFARYGS